MPQGVPAQMNCTRYIVQQLVLLRGAHSCFRRAVYETLPREVRKPATYEALALEISARQNEERSA